MKIVFFPFLSLDSTMALHSSLQYSSSSGIISLQRGQCLCGKISVDLYFFIADTCSKIMNEIKRLRKKKLQNPFYTITINSDSIKFGIFQLKKHIFGNFRIFFQEGFGVFQKILEFSFPFV